MEIDLKGQKLSLDEVKKVCPLRPEAEKLVLLRDNAATMVGGLYLPGQDRPDTGRVIHIGPDLPEAPGRMDTFEEGARYAYQRHSENEYRVGNSDDGVRWVVLDANDMIAKISEGAEVFHARD